MKKNENIRWRAHPEGAPEERRDIDSCSGWFDMPEESRVLGAGILFACGYPLGFYTDENGSVDLTEGDGIHPDSWFHGGESVFRPKPETFGRRALLTAGFTLERARSVVWGPDTTRAGMPLPPEIVCMPPLAAADVLPNGRTRLEDAARRYLKKFHGSSEALDVFGPLLRGEAPDDENLYRIELFAAAKQIALIAFGASLVSSAGEFVDAMAEVAISAAERIASGEDARGPGQVPEWHNIHRRMGFSEDGLFCSFTEGLLLVAAEVLRQVGDGAEFDESALREGLSVCAELWDIALRGESFILEETLSRFDGALVLAAVAVEGEPSGGGVVL